MMSIQELKKENSNEFIHCNEFSVYYIIISVELFRKKRLQNANVFYIYVEMSCHKRLKNA